MLEYPSLSMGTRVSGHLSGSLNVTRRSRSGRETSLLAPAAAAPGSLKAVHPGLR